MNRIRLHPGEYRAVEKLTVSTFQGNQHLDYRIVPAGETFSVPRHVNGFWSAVTYHPDSGEHRPTFQQLRSDPN